MNEKYEINSGTLAIVSLADGNSRVYEDYRNYVIPCSAQEILEHSCQYFGSTYEGRRQGAKSVIGANYKLPIIIYDSIIFFPTTSPDDIQCVWIALNKISNYYPGKYNTCRVSFINGTEIVIPTSFHVIENQIYRSTRLMHILKERQLNIISGIL